MRWRCDELKIQAPLCNSCGGGIPAPLINKLEDNLMKINLENSTCVVFLESSYFIKKRPKSSIFDLK